MEQTRTSKFRTFSSSESSLFDSIRRFFSWDCGTRSGAGGGFGACSCLIGLAKPQASRRATHIILHFASLPMHITIKTAPRGLYLKQTDIAAPGLLLSNLSNCIRVSLDSNVTASSDNLCCFCSKKRHSGYRMGHTLHDVGQASYSSHALALSQIRHSN